MLPNATTAGITFVDALFMATTSVCVTGLATMDVASAFTSVGQTIILVLVQIGGIGVMTFTAFIALSFMGKSSFSSKIVLKDMLNEVKTGGLFQVIFNILFVTFFIEGIGAYLIFQSVKGTLPGGATEELFYALFHAVIGFCNAGMSTLSGNMAIHSSCTITLCIFRHLLDHHGSIGFPIVFNFLSLFRHQLANGLRLLFRQQSITIHTPHIINLHTYVVVTATLLLLIGGFSLYLLFEYHNSLQGLPWDEKLTQALFGAATPRSAGFNATDVCALASPTLILTLALMLIGAGPVSTGSGLKVTTVTIALLAIVHILTGRKELTIHGRTISSELILRSFATIMLTLAWLLLVFILLSFTEQGYPLQLLFERHQP